MNAVAHTTYEIAEGMAVVCDYPLRHQIYLYPNSLGVARIEIGPRAQRDLLRILRARLEVTAEGIARLDEQDERDRTATRPDCYR